MMRYLFPLVIFLTMVVYIFGNQNSSFLVSTYSKYISIDLLHIKNGVTLLALDSTIADKVRNYSNYNFVYFVLSLIFLMQLIVAYKNRTK